jgi:hypothetical protein
LVRVSIGSDGGSKIIGCSTLVSLSIIYNQQNKKEVVKKRQFPNMVFESGSCITRRTSSFPLLPWLLSLISSMGS